MFEHGEPRIAFYAPLKTPDDPIPSGDREIARLLVTALCNAGFAVDIASRLRSFDGRGDRLRQHRLATIGARCAQRLRRGYLRRAASHRPQLWFTYHLYYKAPDWLGPSVAHSLGIPYVVAEASSAPKRLNGPWAGGERAVVEAVRSAHLVLELNPRDAPCIRPHLRQPSCLVSLAPFVDAGRLRQPAEARAWQRARVRRELGCDDREPLLLTVAMMRPGDKLASYQVLACALRQLAARPWRLIVAGDGPARPDVVQAFAPVHDRTLWLGRRDAEALLGLYAAADLFVWPAIGEAIGLAVLEAQAAGLAVICGASGALTQIVADRETGRLCPPGDAAVFADALGDALADLPRCRAWGAQASRHVTTHHDLPVASRRLRSLLGPLIGQPEFCH